MYTLVKELPTIIQTALSRVEYGCKDIEVKTAESLSPGQGGGQGRRSFLVLINLATGAVEQHTGSWGGANPFENRQVDLDQNSYPIPEGLAALKGSMGHPRTFATLYLHPANVAKLLPPKTELNIREVSILRDFHSLTSAGRKNEWARNPQSAPSQAELDSLVSQGLLSRNKAGALSITTAGKNAL